MTFEKLSVRLEGNMLTASQVRTVAFVTDDGVVCVDCAHDAFDNGEDVSDWRPLIAYEADELATTIGQDYEWEDEDVNHEYCSPALLCDINYQHEIVEEYHDEHNHDAPRSAE